MSKPPQLSPTKRRLFAVMTALLPVLFFVLLEGGLRLAGYGASYPLFEPVPDFPAYRYQNRDVARRYFGSLQNVPTGLNDVFRAEKDSATVRLFVQGGSSAAGYPYYYGGAFSRMLQQRLQQTFPDRDIEVVNTALAAVNSYTLLDFADEILDYAPDAVLIYAGHNEYYGALGVGSSVSLGAGRGLTNLYLALRDVRTVQALRGFLGWVAGLTGGPSAGTRPDATLMERMVGEQAIAYGSPLYEAGLDQFRGNLRALLATYRAAGVPVFLGTVASNERAHPPFRSGLAPTTDADAFGALVRDARAAVTRGDTTAALATLAEAAEVDSLAADIRFATARLHDARHRFAQARAAYLAAKDRDELRFRAPEAINRILREEAERAGAVIVETQSALRAAAHDGIIGSDLMLEHLHPNIDGYFRIADTFYEALRADGFPAPWTAHVPADEARAELLVTAVDSLFGALRVRQLMGSWPFQPPGVVDHSIDTLTARTQPEQFALDLFRKERSWYEATMALRAYYEEQGDHHRALKAALALIQQYPMIPEGYLAAGNLLAKQRRLDEALAYLDAANDRRETADAHYMIGTIYLFRQQAAAALPHLKRASALTPNNPQTLYQLSGAYALAGQNDDARATLRRLLSVAPDHAGARTLLGQIGE